MIRRSFLFAALVTFVTACSPQHPPEKAPEAAAIPGPAAMVRALYDPYLTEGATFPAFGSLPWSSSLSAELDAMSARSEALNEPILDFDPVIDAQDYQLANVAVSTDGMVENSHATVRASFTNMGQAREVVYDLVWENNGWRIDNIRTPEWDLRVIASAPAAP